MSVACDTLWNITLDLGSNDLRKQEILKYLFVSLFLKGIIRGLKKKKLIIIRG